MSKSIVVHYNGMERDSPEEQTRKLRELTKYANKPSFGSFIRKFWLQLMFGIVQLALVQPSEGMLIDCAAFTVGAGIGWMVKIGTEAKTE